MFKKLYLFLVLILAGSLISGCSSSADYTTLQFASWGSKSEIDILKPILNDFEKENPNIKVHFLHIPQNYFQKIHLLFASNTAPDVIFINNLYLPIYADAGVLEPLDDIIKDKEKFYPQALQTLSRNGKLYAVARDVSNLVIYYNQDIFDKYGAAYPDKDWSMDDFLKTAKMLTHKPYVYGISFEEDPLFYLPYLMSEGGGILSDDLQDVIIDSPQSRKGLDFYADLRNKYGTAPKKSESASATMAQMFLQKKLAMHLTGRWLVPKYRQEANFRWDIAPFPKGSKGSIVPMDASGWAISKNTKHPNEAKKLVDFLSSKRSIEQFSQCGLIVPARKDVAESAAFLDGKAPRNAKVFLDIIETSKPTPVNVNYKEITDELKKKLEYKFN